MHLNLWVYLSGMLTYLFLLVLGIAKGGYSIVEMPTFENSGCKYMIWFTAANLALSITQFSKVSLTCYMNIKFSIDSEASSKKFLLVFADKITESVSEVRDAIGISERAKYVTDHEKQVELEV